MIAPRTALHRLEIAYFGILLLLPAPAIDRWTNLQLGLLNRVQPSYGYTTNVHYGKIETT